jgi:hypothetical protein
MTKARPGGNKWRVRALTTEEVQASVDDINARMAQLEQLWERSGRTDVRALRGALILLEAQLPPWVFAGLMQRLDVPEDESARINFHRWALVCEVRKARKAGKAQDRIKGKLSNRRRKTGEDEDEDDFEVASIKSQGTPVECGRDMMEKSFRMIENALPLDVRISRPRKPRRPRA